MNNGKNIVCLESSFGNFENTVGGEIFSLIR